MGQRVISCPLNIFIIWVLKGSCGATSLNSSENGAFTVSSGHTLPNALLKLTMLSLSFKSN